MPDNEAERPTTAPPEPVAASEAPAAGDAPSDPTTTGGPEATARSPPPAPPPFSPYTTGAATLGPPHAAQRLDHSVAATSDQTPPAERGIIHRAGAAPPPAQPAAGQRHECNATSHQPRRGHRTQAGGAQRPRRAAPQRQC